MDLLRKQRPFWLGGLFVGLAELVFYFKYDYFIPVTTGLAQMYAVTEQRLLGLDFIGGTLFSFGTRIAGGCTTHHFLGGVPGMSIPSWAELSSGIPFAFAAYKIAMGLGVGGDYRHQDSRSVATAYEACAHNPYPGHDPGDDPRRDVLRWALLVFAGLLVLAPIGFALFGSIQGGIDRIGWAEAAWMTIAWLLLGLSAITVPWTRCSYRSCSTS